jgi:sugar/nucleoside kinase (ribokinase family)
MPPSSKRQRTISIGGATFDLFVKVDHSIVRETDGTDAFTLPLGKKVRVKEVVNTCGGGASNTSVGLARLGCDASFCGVVGDDKWGELLVSNLKKEGVTTESVTMIEGETSSFSIVLNAESGERVLLYEPGTNARLHDITFDREAAKSVDWVYLNHIQAESCVIEDDLVDILTAPPHPHLTWNPGGCQIDVGLTTESGRALVKEVDLLLMNREEALAFTRNETIEDALKTLSQAGAKVICITDGKNGTYATDGKTLFHCPIIPCPVVDTTGAGDAFGTAATWALLRGYDLPTMLRSGTINAMSVVGAVGAQAGLLTDTEIQLRLERTNIVVTTSAL